MELATLLEHKMKVMKEMVEVVNKNPNQINELEGLSLENSTISPLNKANNPPQACQTHGIILPIPDYSSLVKEQKDRNYYTKEQLLNAVQVSFIKC